MLKSKSGILSDRRSVLMGAGASLIGLTFLPRGSLSAEEKQLNFYNWDTYIGETTLDDFAKASGIETKMDLYADNAELFAKMKEGNPGYDVIVPTNDYVERMMAAGMLETIDHSKIPNFSNLEKRFQDSNYDPGRKHTVPYMWGTIGVGYRKSKATPVPDSWKWLYASDKYAGKIALLGDGQTVLQQGLKYLGYSLNDKDPAHIKQSEELVIAQKKNIKVFADDNGQDLLASGEVDVVQEWNGDILQVMDEDDDIGYAVPVEGGLLWEDCLCIPKGAPHPENALAFINFLLDADVGAAIADFIQYATPNAAAKAKMDKAYLDNPAIFPPNDVIAKCEASIYQGEAVTRLFEDAWTRVQAA